MIPDMNTDGLEYYDTVLLYTDDVPVASKNREYILREQIGNYFELKKDPIGYPEIHLGGKP